MKTLWRWSHRWWRELMHRYQEARWVHLLGGLLVFLVTLCAGWYAQQMELRDREAQRRVQLVTQGASLRAALTHELSSVLYLSSGLRSYLTVRHASLAGDEIQRILEDLYRSASHVRNFSVAVNVTVRYVYPVAGNERAIGLHYPSTPGQWAQVRQVRDTGEPLLVGPLPLVQGGVGMIYRVPVMVDGRYWGLVSTVIDVPSLLRDAHAQAAVTDLEVAIRGRDGLGLHGDVFFGSEALFERSDAVLTDVDVPGGKWVIAMAEPPAMNVGGWRLAHVRNALWQALVAVVALVLGLGTTVILGQRAQLMRMAWRDMLTGLPNRQLIEDRIQLGLARHRRSTALFAVLFIDLDGFKRVNDRLGHKAGDALLKQAGERLQAAVRATDLVGRWGGDEFVVVLDGGDRGFVDAAVQRVRSALDLSVRINGEPYRVGASIGVGRIPEDGRSVAAVVRAADMRMYRDKAERKREADEREGPPTGTAEEPA